MPTKLQQVQGSFELPGWPLFAIEHFQPIPTSCCATSRSSCPCIAARFMVRFKSEICFCSSTTCLVNERTSLLFVQSF